MNLMKAMQKRLLSNPKIEVLWQTEVVEAFGNEDGNLGEESEGNGNLDEGSRVIQSRNLIPYLDLDLDLSSNQMQSG